MKASHPAQDSLVQQLSWLTSALCPCPSNLCLVCMRACPFTQLCPALCDPMDCGTPGSSVHGILQVGILGVGCHFLLQEIFLNEGYICYLHLYGDTYIYITGHICISGYIYEHICIPIYTRFISALKTCRD